MKTIITHFLLLLTIAGFACGGSATPTPPPGEPQQTTASPAITDLSAWRQIYRRECIDYCYRIVQCGQTTCNEDYPGSVSDWSVSVAVQNCITKTCETNVYVDFAMHKSEYLTCTSALPCREISTGSCGDTVECLGTPGSTPYLPGTKTHAPPPTAPPG